MNCIARRNIQCCRRTGERGWQDHFTYNCSINLSCQCQRPRPFKGVYVYVTITCLNLIINLRHRVLHALSRRLDSWRRTWRHTHTILWCSISVSEIQSRRRSTRTVDMGAPKPVLHRMDLKQRWGTWRQSGRSRWRERQDGPHERTGSRNSIEWRQYWGWWALQCREFRHKYSAMTCSTGTLVVPSGS